MIFVEEMVLVGEVDIIVDFVKINFKIIGCDGVVIKCG